MTRRAEMTAGVAIVGGGIVGAACAEALAREKADVLLIEPGLACGAGGATAAGMGHVVAMDDSEAQFALTAYSLRLWRGLADRLSGSVEFERNGTLWIAADDADEMAAVRAKHAYYSSRGMAAEILDARGLQAAEPELRRGLAGALLTPADCVIYAPCAAAWLAEEARRSGARILAGIAAATVGPRRVQLADGTAVSADLVIVAAGVASTRLIPGLAVRPRKGHLAITDRYPGFLRHQVVELGYLRSAHGHASESVAFNVQPRATGQLLVGSSRQYDVEHDAIEQQVLGQMLRRAIGFLPALAGLSVIRTWTGFRAATPDSLPLIGPVDEGLWVATGHEGLGITTSLGTAQLIADRFRGRQAAIPDEPYLPLRFANEASREH